MDHTRHSSIFNAHSVNMELIGAGGIGAMTALVAAKMGVGNLTIYDEDVVSEENLATQLHRMETIGQPKVEALDETLRMFADDTNIWPVVTRVGDTDNEMIAGTHVVSAVDSIAARKGIWSAVKNGRVHWYLDARMSAEVFQLYTVDMTGDWSWYDEMIAKEDDSKIPDVACTEKATFYCAAVAAGIIGATIRKTLTKITPPRYLVFNMRDDVFMAMGQA